MYLKFCTFALELLPILICSLHYRLEKFILYPQIQIVTNWICVCNICSSITQRMPGEILTKHDMTQYLEKYAIGVRYSKHSLGMVVGSSDM